MNTTKQAIINQKIINTYNKMYQKILRMGNVALRNTSTKNIIKTLELINRFWIL